MDKCNIVEFISEVRYMESLSRKVLAVFTLKTGQVKLISQVKVAGGENQ